MHIKFRFLEIYFYNQKWLVLKLAFTKRRLYFLHISMKYSLSFPHIFQSNIQQMYTVHIIFKIHDMYYGYVTRYMLSCKRLFNDCCNVFRAFAPAHSMTVYVDGTWTTWTKKTMQCVVVVVREVVLQYWLKASLLIPMMMYLD